MSTEGAVAHQDALAQVATLGAIATQLQRFNDRMERPEPQAIKFMCSATLNVRGYAFGATGTDWHHVMQNIADMLAQGGELSAVDGARVELRTFRV